VHDARAAVEGGCAATRAGQRQRCTESFISSVAASSDVKGTTSTAIEEESRECKEGMCRYHDTLILLHDWSDNET
jgi:hypothetical protein